MTALMASMDLKAGSEWTRGHHRVVSTSRTRNRRLEVSGESSGIGLLSVLCAPHSLGNRTCEIVECGIMWRYAHYTKEALE